MSKFDSLNLNGCDCPLGYYGPSNSISMDDCIICPDGLTTYIQGSNTCYCEPGSTQKLPVHLAGTLDSSNCSMCSVGQFGGDLILFPNDLGVNPILPGEIGAFTSGSGYYNTASLSNELILLSDYFAPEKTDVYQINITNPNPNNWDKERIFNDPHDISDISGSRIIIRISDFVVLEKDEFYSSWNATNIDTSAYSSQYSRSLSLFEDTFIFGFNPDAAGAAAIFQENEPQSWNEVARFNGISESGFGYAVAIYGDHSLVGAPYATCSSTGDWGCGLVHAYSRNATNAWNEIQSFTPSNIEYGDFFGASLSIYEFTAVIGSDYLDCIRCSSVWVFHFDPMSSPIPVWKETAVLTASDTQFRDFFGASLALYKNTLIVGAKGRHCTSNEGTPLLECGAAYLFSANSTNQWHEVALFTKPEYEQYERFGQFVDITENLAIVGQGYPRTDSSVYVYSTTTQTCFDCPPGSFSANGTCVSCSTGTYQDQSGQAQCISCPFPTISPLGSTSIDQCIECPVGTFIETPGQSECKPCPDGLTTFPNTGISNQCLCPIGSYNEDWFSLLANGGYLTSPLYSFDSCKACPGPTSGGDSSLADSSFSATLSWSDIWESSIEATTKLLVPSSLIPSFGQSASIYKNVAVTGSGLSFCNDTSIGSNCGSAQIWKLESDGWNDGWTELANLKPTTEIPSSLFGVSAKIYENTVVIGAPGSNRAYIFSRSDNSDAWSEKAILIGSNSAPTDQFGYSVDVFEDLVVVGAWNAQCYNSTLGGCGATYLYQHNRTTELWDEVGILYASNGKPQDYFGEAVDIERNIIVIGAWAIDGGQGSAYIFKQAEPLVWVEAQVLTASNNALGGSDAFGHAVVTYEDFVVVGAPLAESTSGAAYVYQSNSTGQWQEIAILTASDSQIHSFHTFGNAVAMSSVGSQYIIVIGSQDGAYIFHQDPSDSSVWNEVMIAGRDFGGSFRRSTSSNVNRGGDPSAPGADVISMSGTTTLVGFSESNRVYSFSLIGGDSLCSNCTAGNFGASNSNTGFLICEPCPTGTWQSLEGQLTCDLCPPGTTSITTGLTSPEQCISCPAGTYGDILSGGFCQPCPEGSYSTEPGQTSLDACSFCEPGEFTDDPAVTCRPCSEGSYQDEPGASICKSCPAGSYSQRKGSISNSDCSLCQLGTFSEQAGSSNCTACPINTFSDSLGSTSCTQCEGLFTTNEPGSSSCDTLGPAVLFIAPAFGALAMTLCLGAFAFVRPDLNLTDKSDMTKLIENDDPEAAAALPNILADIEVSVISLLEQYREDKISFPLSNSKEDLVNEVVTVVGGNASPASLSLYLQTGAVDSLNEFKLHQPHVWTMDTIRKAASNGQVIKIVGRQLASGGESILFGIGIILRVLITAGDFFTDAAFLAEIYAASEAYTVLNDINNNEVNPWRLPLIIASCALIASALCGLFVSLYLFISTTKNDPYFNYWFSTRLGRSKSVALLFFGLTNLDNLDIVNARTIALPWLKFDSYMLPRSARRFRNAGLFTLFLEDIPFFTVQMIVLSIRGGITINSAQFISLVFTVALLFWGLGRRLVSWLFFDGATRTGFIGFFGNAMKHIIPTNAFFISSAGEGKGAQGKDSIVIGKLLEKRFGDNLVFNSNSDNSLLRSLDRLMPTLDRCASGVILQSLEYYNRKWCIAEMIRLCEIDIPLFMIDFCKDETELEKARAKLKELTLQYPILEKAKNLIYEPANGSERFYEAIDQFRDEIIEYWMSKFAKGGTEAEAMFNNESNRKLQFIEELGVVPLDVLGGWSNVIGLWKDGVVSIDVVMNSILKSLKGHTIFTNSRENTLRVISALAAEYPKSPSISESAVYVHLGKQPPQPAEEAQGLRNAKKGKEKVNNPIIADQPIWPPNEVLDLQYAQQVKEAENESTDNIKGKTKASTSKSTRTNDTNNSSLPNLSKNQVKVKGPKKTDPSTRRTKSF